LFVHGLEKNFLLVSCMADLYCIVEFDALEVIFRIQTRVLQKGVCVGGLYRLHVDLVKHGACVHGSTNLCGLWHKPLSHLHYEALHILRDLLQGFPDLMIEKKGVCKGCALGKHVKAAFPNNEHRSRKNICLIHSNVCGPISSAYLTSSWYYVTCIDDFSRRI